MAAYVEYDYYKEVFGGVAIPSDLFKSHALRASREVDKITLYRIQNAGNPNGYEVDGKVKNAVCAVADVLFKQDEADKLTGGGAISSETVKSHTVSFKTQTAEERERQSKKEIQNAARDFLATTGLLYRGAGRMCGL